MASAAQRYVFNHPTEYKLREKAFSLSGDSFSVKDAATKQAVFKVKGNAISIKDSKKLLDASGTPLYKMTESMLTLRGRMHIKDASTNKTVFTLRKKGFIPMMGTKTIQVWAGDDDDGAPTIEGKGDFFRKDFHFTDVATGRTVAKIKRKSLNFSNLVLEKDSYVVHVEPGVNSALFVILAIAVDEQYRDDGNRKGVGSTLESLF